MAQVVCIPCYVMLYFPWKKGRTQTVVYKLAVRSFACMVMRNPKVTPQVGLAQYSLTNLLMMPDGLSVFEDVQLLARKLNLQLCHPCEKNTERYV